ncbi:MAG: hypothetical protein AAFQ19_11895 [Pseudomonadota bacterium]
MPYRHVKSLSFAFLMLAPVCAEAQEAPDVAAFAAALNMTEAQVRSCLPADMVPGKRLPRSEREAVFGCFQQINPNVTQSDLRTAMRSAQR